MIINSLKKILFFNLVFFSLNAFSNEVTQNNPKTKTQVQSFTTDLQTVVKAATKQKSFSVEFTQQTFSLLRNKVSESNGILSIKKPASFRFEVTKPRNELYVSNGKEFWKYVADLKHAQYLKNLSQEFGFVQVLTNLSQLQKYYHVSQWTDEEAKKLNQSANISPVESDTPPEKNNDFILLKLVPKGDKQQKVLYAIIQVKTGFIQELRIVQLNGNRIRLVFLNHSLKLLTDEVFQFTPPQGIVVDKL
ncbi:LolA family protein [Fluviispira multicolorata]|uniref:Outer-membrane lipoprotein carrier protein n=1 Tax=Fluviispira multicolorata TaxID=2654512 RepID=A0A833JFS5_9BACT|nr:outer membrane lipoprotein carrier protein LolA [Fluviispira multicolorata]KAB8031786.1 hypothetical protein GCL57_03865 [Fluviispira multicolorata]